MRSCFSHPPGSAASAESAALATKCDQVFELTRLTLGPQKSVRKYPATQILIELLDHKIRHWVTGIIEHRRYSIERRQLTLILSQDLIIK